jgi:hypothetical protein
MFMNCKKEPKQRNFQYHSECSACCVVGTIMHITAAKQRVELDIKLLVVK